MDLFLPQMAGDGAVIEPICPRVMKPRLLAPQNLSLRRQRYNEMDTENWVCQSGGVPINGAE